ncbi:MAG: methionine synthase [Nocardioides sp.]|uniref:methionine synthase n=1 Tax=Nocardioides sp. TaxID=35761 RepID=UPI0039E2DC1F
MLATAVGSYPGSDDRDYVEVVRLVFGELPDLPHVPELPGRGAIASITGRGVAVLSELGADLQPAGWRLTDAAGIDQRRARSLLAQDLDRVEEQAQGYAGAVKAQIVGPWTLAATVERPRGDKVLADHGARRELAQALAEGVVHHVADLRRRLPEVDRLVIQVDEPALATVLAAKVPTASGFGRHRAVDLPEASAALGWVLAAIEDAGAEPWVHSCAPGTPYALVRGAGARGLSVDLAMLVAADHDELARALEAGGTVALGVVPAVDPEPRPGEGQAVDAVERWLGMLGLDPDTVGDRLVVTPACGLAGASPVWVREALARVARAAREL